MIFMVFLYKKLFLKKKFAYLPTHKNILTFPETRHLFFFALIEIVKALSCQVIARALWSLDCFTAHVSDFKIH